MPLYIDSLLDIRSLITKDIKSVSFEIVEEEDIEERIQRSKLLGMEVCGLNTYAIQKQADAKNSITYPVVPYLHEKDEPIAIVNLGLGDLVIIHTRKINFSDTVDYGEHREVEPTKVRLRTLPELHKIHDFKRDIKNERANNTCHFEVQLKDLELDEKSEKTTIDDRFKYELEQLDNISKCLDYIQKTTCNTPELDKLNISKLKRLGKLGNGYNSICGITIDLKDKHIETSKELKEEIEKEIRNEKLDLLSEYLDTIEYTESLEEIDRDTLTKLENNQNKQKNKQCLKIDPGTKVNNAINLGDYILLKYKGANTPLVGMNMREDKVNAKYYEYPFNDNGARYINLDYLDLSNTTYKKYFFYSEILGKLQCKYVTLGDIDLNDITALHGAFKDLQIDTFDFGEAKVENVESISTIFRVTGRISWGYIKEVISGPLKFKKLNTIHNLTSVGCLGDQCRSFDISQWEIGDTLENLEDAFCNTVVDRLDISCIKIDKKSIGKLNIKDILKCSTIGELIVHRSLYELLLERNEINNNTDISKITVRE